MLELFIILDKVAFDDVELVSTSWETVSAGVRHGKLVELGVSDLGKGREVKRRKFRKNVSIEGLFNWDGHDELR